MDIIQSTDQPITNSKTPELWKSPLGHVPFIVSVMILLILTILKYASNLNFIRASYEISKDKKVEYDIFNVILYGAWVIVPPLIFLIEYVFIFGKDESRRLDRDQCADIKYCHDLASKIWAGV